jgi:mono/diheme cytochrome c family protein
MSDGQASDGQTAGEVRASGTRARSNRRWLFGLLALVVVLFAVGAFGAWLWSSRPVLSGPQGYPLADSQAFDRVERGRYLAVLADCAACHTAPGGEPYAGGLALETPFGTLVAPNITPDRETGIGSWTDDEFIAAMHGGRGRDGILLFPAMPYPAYTRMTRED